MIRILLAFLLFFSVFTSFSQSNTSSPSSATPRRVLSLNQHWAFHRGEAPGAEQLVFQDGNWSAVTIPHVMRLEKKHNGGGGVYQGTGWYRRYFRVDARDKGKRLTLHFDGVQMNCDVYLNGVKLMTHHGGYLGFVIDISGNVRFNTDNILAVRVTDVDDPFTPPGKPMAKLDFNYYAGIYRDVRLSITDAIHISDPLEAGRIAGGGLFVSYPSVNVHAATVHVKTQVVNASGREAAIKLVTTILDKKGQVVARSVSNAGTIDSKEFEQELLVRQPALWHPDHPNLYQLRSSVYNNGRLCDVVTTPIGIRSISFKSPSGAIDGFYINGEKLYLRGANRHQSYQYVGDAAPASMQRRDAIELKKGGFNAVRASHYPQSPAFLDACDELGLLVIECEPGWQFFNKDSVFVNRSYRDIREMIRRDRNRPSVFLWETSLNESPTPDFWAKEAVRIAHEEMPNDQLFTADDFFAKGRKYYDVSYKVINEDGTDPMPSMPSLTREWGDTWIANPAKENGLRASRLYTEKGLIAQCRLRQNALNGSMHEAEGAYWDHARMDANPRIGGYFLWSFNDYTRGSDPLTAFSGVVDIDRREKFGYYQLQAMQSARNPVYGPMVYIASYNNQPSLDSTIMVFSNCDRVKLFRNNKLIGEMTRTQNSTTAPFIAGKGGSPYFLFRTGAYEAGELRAEGYLDRRKAATHSITTAGAPDHLEIEIADRGIQPIADQCDLLPFYIKICDKNGTIISNQAPMQSYSIDLQVEGAGVLVGDGITGIGMHQLSEGGIAYGLLRTTALAGIATIRAHSDGLKPAQAMIRTLPSSAGMVADGKHAAWTIEKTQRNWEEKEWQQALQPVIPLSVDKISIQQDEGIRDIEKLVDEDMTTVWTLSREALPVTVGFDLGKLYLLQASKLVWGKDSDWYTYTMQVSTDKQRWKAVLKDKLVSGQEYQPEMLNAAQARYVRLIISRVQPEKSRLAVAGITFYGKPVAN